MKEHKELHFPEQRANEHVVLMLRRHWTILARDMAQLVLMLFIPPIVLAFGFFFMDFSVEPNSLFYVFLVTGLSIYYLVTFVTYFHDFVDYHLDVWIVTDQRIISIEQTGLFNRVISELNITKLQDVSSEIKGKVQTLLDYGQVYIQTAGQRERFVFEQVPHPAEVAKVVLQLHDRGVRQEYREHAQESAAYQQQMMQQPPPAVPAQPQPTNYSPEPPTYPQQ
jgi:uncharacterized membrane protein YdbT with pleckstrin-like domain